MYVRASLVIMSLSLLTACDNPRATRIPADLSKIADIQTSLDKLDSADRRRVAAYEMRAHMGGLFGGDAPAAGVTIGEAIDAQKAFEATEARQADEAKALAQKVAAERAAKLALMDHALVAALTDREVSRGPFLSMIGYAVSFQNTSAKTIIGIKGTGVFRDAFDDEVARQSVKVERPIAAGQTLTVNRAIVLSDMESGYSKLKDTPVDKIKFRLEPSVILFDDGSKLEAPDAEDAH